MPRLPQAPDSRHLRRPRIWSLTGHRRISPPKHPISSSTPWPTSAEVQLRLISGGTSHSRPRLAFHPYAQLIRVICTSTPVQPSTRLSAGFSLARHRSTGFGHRTHDSSRAHDAPRALRRCAHVAFASAPRVERLTSPWIRTPWPVIHNGERDAAPSFRTSSLSRRVRLLLSGFRHFSPPVKGTFQLSLTLLVRYRSRVVFRVGCLCHPPSRAISDARYSGYPESPSPRTSTGLSPSLASAFHRSSSWRGQVCRSPNTTRPPPFSGGFGLLCTLFDRLYLGHPVWSLFLPVLGCFDCGGFRSFRNNLAVRRSHSEIVGSQVPCAYPTHFAAWHVLRRRPSRAIPQTAC